MKKLSLVVLMSMVMAACTASSYSKKGNASVILSTPKENNTVELVVRKDDGEQVVLLREYDSYITVGSRVSVKDADNHQDQDLKPIHRYEFK